MKKRDGVDARKVAFEVLSRNGLHVSMVKKPSVVCVKPTDDGIMVEPIEMHVQRVISKKWYGKPKTIGGKTVKQTVSTVKRLKKHPAITKAHFGEDE